MNRKMGIGAALAWTGRNGILIMPLGLAVGLLSPELCEFSRPLADYMVLVLFTLSIFLLDPRALALHLRRPAAVASGVAWILLLIPFVAYAVGSAAGLPPGLLAVTVMWSACPPLVSIPGLAVLCGLDGAMALLLLVGSMMVFTASLPFILSFLVGDILTFDPFELLLRLGLIVSSCLLAGQGLRRLVGHERAMRYTQETNGVLVLLLALFAVTIMGGFHEALAHYPGQIPLFIAVTFLASLGVQLLSAAAFFPAARLTGGAVALASGHRNIAIMLPAAGGAFGSDFLLFIAVIQFPIYLLPVLMRPVFRWYCR